MALFKRIQASFTAGEISPRLLARVDLDTYEKAAKTIENAYPFTHGGVTRRPGTSYVGEISDSLEGARLVPFVYARDQAYLLVFNNFRIEFIGPDGKFIESSPGVRYFKVSPYSESQLSEFTYAQSGSLLFMAHDTTQPLQVERITDTNWQITNLPFLYNAISDHPFENGYIAFQIITTADGHLPDDYYTIDVDAFGVPTIAGPIAGGGNPAPTGNMVAVDVNLNNIVVQQWTITCISKSTNRETWSVVGDQIVGDSSPVQWYFGNYPRAVSFYEQRLWFAGSPEQTQALWGSAAGDYSNFTLGPLDADGVNFTIASNRFDQIIHLDAARALLPFTVGSEFSASGGDRTGITPTSIKLRAHTFHGANDVKPLRVGKEVLFVQRDGKKVRAVSYDVSLDGNVAPDLTLIAEHITEDPDFQPGDPATNGIIDGTFAQDPDFITWYVRDDGTLLSLTHMREQAVTAWARHTTQGTFENATAIPNGNTDRVYFVVRRIINGAIKKYIEFLDEGTNLDAQIHLTAGVATDTWTGLDHLEGETVSIVADGRVHPDLVVASGTIVLQRTALEVDVGLGYNSKIELLHPEVPLGDGTAQGRATTIKSIVVRLKDTVGLTVNGNPDPVIELETILNQPTPPFTGDKQIYATGWQFPNNMLIEQVIPMPFTLLGVVMKVEVND